MILNTFLTISNFSNFSVSQTGIHLMAFSWSTWVSWYEKDNHYGFSDSYDDKVAVATAGSYANHLHCHRVGFVTS